MDYNDADQNPLMTLAGVEEIKAVSDQTGVKVLSVCADYFMEAPLHDEDYQVAEHSVEVLKQLLESSMKLGIRNIVIPCVVQTRH